MSSKQFWTIQEDNGLGWVLLRQAYHTEDEAIRRSVELSKVLPNAIYKIRPVVVTFSDTPMIDAIEVKLDGGGGLAMFSNSPETQDAAKALALRVLNEHPLDMLIDEWHQLDDFHDVISDSEENNGTFVVWVYPVIDGETFTQSERAYEVKLDLPPRKGCKVCEWTVATTDSDYCHVCIVPEEDYRV